LNTKLVNGDSREPSHVDPQSYGWNAQKNVFEHPAATPFSSGPRPTKGSLSKIDDQSYIQNMTVEGHWPLVVRDNHSWHNIVDLDGRRYMYHYYRSRLNVYDITDAKTLKVLLEKEYGPDDEFGAAVIAYNPHLKKTIMLQSIEVPRSVGGLDGKKYADPSRVAAIRNIEGLRGFRVFELVEPTRWELLAEVSTDVLNTKSRVQAGSGVLDMPTYFGGRYAIFAAAPDDTFCRMEYSNYLYSPSQMIYDLSDPANPRHVSTWWVPGQRLGEEDAYLQWHTAGNRTSWTGARMPVFLPIPLEGGGRYGYAMMGSLGLYVLDLVDPANPKVIGHLDLPESVAGFEGDNVDVSRIDRGFIFVNGYPMNEDGYEPYKDVFVVDVREPNAPRITGRFPRPVVPPNAPFADFALRRGKFGPKRPGYYHQPGKAHPNVAIYPYHNGGVQVFDVKDPNNAKVVAFFVPKMTDELNNPRSHIMGVHAIIVEWDRNLIWAFSNSGIYLLSTPALGVPSFGK
jgi:hypothetical protein